MKVNRDLMLTMIRHMDLATLQACIDDLELQVQAGVDRASEDLLDCVAERDKRLK
jgi:hypothetical protein